MFIIISLMDDIRRGKVGPLWLEIHYVQITEWREGTLAAPASRRLYDNDLAISSTIFAVRVLKEAKHCR